MGKQTRLNQWLRDAHAAEKQAEALFAGTARRNEDYPEFSERLREQAALARDHAETLERCLALRGQASSAFQDASARLAAVGQSLSGLVVGDEIVKASLAIAAFVRLKTASFRSLVAAAGELGEQRIKQACATLLYEDEDFAKWLDQQIPLLTAQFLEKDAA